jgi:hypothetical protein
VPSQPARDALIVATPGGLGGTSTDTPSRATSPTRRYSVESDDVTSKPLSGVKKLQFSPQDGDSSRVGDGSDESSGKVSPAPIKKACLCLAVLWSVFDKLVE